MLLQDLVMVLELELENLIQGGLPRNHHAVDECSPWLASTPLSLQHGGRYFLISQCSTL